MVSRSFASCHHRYEENDSGKSAALILAVYNFDLVILLLHGNADHVLWDSVDLLVYSGENKIGRIWIGLL